MATGWRIELFSGLRAVEIHDADGGSREVTRFRTQRTGALLAYLAYHRERRHLRETLIELLWPGCDPSSGRNRLSQALSALRHQLELPGERGGDLILADRHSVRLDPARVSTDVADFVAALQAASRSDAPTDRVQWLGRAVDLYRGDLLPGDYDEWVLGEREYLAEAYFQALGELIPLLEAMGDLRQAIQTARRGASVDPLREATQRELVRLLIAAGEPAAALRQYQELERTLERELGTEPEPATRNLLTSLDEKRTGRIGKARDALAPEPVGGAVPLDSSFYLVRPTDEAFYAAIARRDSIVLVKGAREMGKTSLLARGLQRAREAGARVVVTDFQKLGTAHLASTEVLLRTLAEGIAVQLDLSVLPQACWNPHCGPTSNFELYLRRDVLGRTATPLVWGLDDLDRLFSCDWGSEVFSLFRSWHNARSFDPAGPWSHLTLAISYATEAHLYLTNLNESPFNVGTRLTLQDFTFEQAAELNQRYGAPLSDNVAMARFHRLVHGHPYLVRRGLSEMAAGQITCPALETQGDRDGGIFDDHLRRLLLTLTRNPELCEVMRKVLLGEPCPTAESFYRLRSAGVIVGETVRDARPRCQLYATYLERHLL